MRFLGQPTSIQASLVLFPPYPLRHLSSMNHQDFDFDRATREEQIEYLASIGFSWRDIAIYLREDVRAYHVAHQDENSPERIAYERGQLITSFSVNEALRSQAADGNTNAVQIMDKKLRVRQWSEAFKNLADEGSRQ